MCLIVLLAGCGLLPSATKQPAWFTSDEATALAEAVARGDEVLITKLVSDGADPNEAGTEGLTMLQWSMMANSLGGMAGLLDAGADPNRTGRDGAVPLEDAIFEESLSFVSLLLSAGANPNVRASVTGSTPLAKVCLFPRVDVLTTLLEFGADPNLVDLNDDAPLHACARTNQGALILLLLQGGADAEVTTSAGASFQDYYFTYPKNVLSDRSLAERADIIFWLEEHDIPVIDAAYS